jgi:hypothetical protein
VFSSGINLTRLYQGKQSYLSFLFRSMGLHSKLYRGVLVDHEADSRMHHFRSPSVRWKSFGSRPSTNLQSAGAASFCWLSIT